MRIGSTFFFAIAAISISQTVSILKKAIDSNQHWLTSLLTVGPIVATIISIYFGFRLIRKGS